MLYQIYILSILVITVVILVYYYTQEIDHRKELEKIEKIESKNKQYQNELELIRSQTLPCPVGDFKDPRSCYFDSGYMCSWNDGAKRCDAKK
jgi:hypothetical protein